MSGGHGKQRTRTVEEETKTKAEKFVQDQKKAAKEEDKK